MLSGLLIKESLQHPEALETLPIRITKTELWTASNPAEFQPALWTAMSFEVEESQADPIAGQLSHALKPRGWFINATTATHVYLIFPNIVFKTAKGDPQARAEALRFGHTIGIPNRQPLWSK